MTAKSSASTARRRARGFFPAPSAGETSAVAAIDSATPSATVKNSTEPA